MLRVNSKIVIGKFEFKYCNSVEIVSSWDEFTDTCKIVLPQRFEFNGKPIIAGEDGLFKRGDKVEVWLGYLPNLKLEFSGFISEVKPGTPFEIHCQDFMWQLKQANITKSYRSVNLKTLLTDLLVGDYAIPFEAISVELGRFRFSNSNIVEVFEELKNKYGLVTWIQNGILYSGLAYVSALQNTEQFNLEHNVIDSKNLIYKLKEDIKIKAAAISIQPDNSRIDVVLGDPTGQQRTFHYFKLTESDLRETAQREIDKLKFDGYRGDMVAFGEPFVQHNDIVEINSRKTPERAGKYLVKKTVTKLTVGGGYRRIITPDRKV